MEGHKLTIKEDRFCHEFIKDFNGTQAAIRAKYSKATARQIACNLLTKVYIKNYIKELLDSTNMGEEEITKRFTDIARTDVSDYLIKKQVPFTPQIKVGLKEVIASRKEFVIREEIYCERLGLVDDEFDKFQEELNSTRASIIRMEIELERNPNAYRIMDGETIMIDEVELDLVSLMNDKEKGKIKSFKNTKDGVVVELYPADSALEKLAKFKGMMIDKSEIDLNGTLDTVVKVGYGGKDPA